jgi:glucose-6-phosphate isomerase
LRRLPAYLQQLEMESNGKRVDAQGQALPYPTTAALWGEVGSNSQHAFFQWLHQGSQRVPTELLLVRRPAHDLDGHHEALLANGLGQAQALMLGAQASADQLAGHQDFPGNRPSTVLLLEELNPASLGALLALYEHRVYVAGLIWGVNSFDQWGVELGKTLARDLETRLGSGDITGLDASTAGLVEWVRGEPVSALTTNLTDN